MKTGKAELVLRQGSVYAAPVAEAVAVSRGRIVYVGSNEGAGAFIGVGTEVIELGGKMVLPGFCDAHMHPLLGALNLQECILLGLSTLPEYLAALAGYAKAHPARSFIRGSGWLNGAFPPEGPRKEDLDGIIPDRPAIVKSVDGHTAWVNSQALRLGGIGPATADPAGGYIGRHPRSGAPTGVLREPAALALVEQYLPAPVLEERLEAMRAFLVLGGKMGITSVCDALVSAEELEVYAALADRGELTMRISAAWGCRPEAGLGQVEEMVAAREKYRRPLVRLLAGKLFVDGVIDGHTAFLHEPYDDRAGFTGRPLWDADDFHLLTTELARENFPVHVHAIGDGALAFALDGLASAKSANFHDLRHQIAHLDLASADDIGRMARLGVMANVQPAWFYEDENIRTVVRPFIGPARTQRLYPLRSFLQAGVRVACGSDWPFGGNWITLNPLDAMQVGITRRGLDGTGEALAPDERVSLAALLDAYTLGGAYAAWQEQITGSIAVGKCADIVVLDGNLFDVLPSEIHRLRVALTMFDGKIIYRAAAL